MLTTKTNSKSSYAVLRVPSPVAGLGVWSVCRVRNTNFVLWHSITLSQGPVGATTNAARACLADAAASSPEILAKSPVLSYA